MKWYAVLLVVIVSFSQLTAQDYLEPNEYLSKLSNGINVYFVKDASAKEVSIEVNIRHGNFAQRPEWKANIGFYEQLITLQQKKWIVSEMAGQAKLKSSTSDNIRVSFSYSVQPVFLKDFLLGLATEFHTLTTDTLLWQEAKLLHNQKIQSERQKDHWEELNNASTLLWKSFKGRTEQGLVTSNFDSSFIAEIEHFYPLLFCPEHVMMSIHGNLNLNQLRLDLQSEMNEWPQCDFIYEKRFSIPQPRELLYSTTQVSINEAYTSPKLYFKLRGPNVNDQNDKALVANWLAKFIQHPKVKQQLLDTLVLKDINLSALTDRYSGEIELAVTPKLDSLDKALYNIHTLLFTDLLLSLATQEVFDDVKDQILKEMEFLKSNPTNRLTAAGLLWSLDDMELFGRYEQKVQVISLIDLKNTLSDYIIGETYIATLATDERSYTYTCSDTIMMNTGTNVEEYQFHFLTNSIDFSSENEDSILTSLAYFLKINPTVKLQVNGVASDQELSSLKNEMRAYMDSVDTKIIIPASLVTSKKIRLDLYRAMVIVKGLTERGIDDKRLRIFGILDNSGQGQKYQRVYCTEVIH